MKSAIGAENTTRVVAERDIARKLRRVLRVRAALSGFLSQHSVGYADVNAAEHGGALAEYILAADARLRQRQEASPQSTRPTGVSVCVYTRSRTRMHTHTHIYIHIYIYIHI